MEYFLIIWNFLQNVFIYILYLFPFWILDNVTAFFPQAYESGMILSSLFILGLLFWFIFVVFLSNILLTPLDDDIKIEESADWTEKKVKYHRTFLWQTIRFILWSKNIITYSSVFMKFISSFGMRLLPLLLILSIVYFPIMPGTKGYSTLWSFTQDNGTIVWQSIKNSVSSFGWDDAKTGSWLTAEQELLKNKFGGQTPELSNMKTKEYVDKLLKPSLQWDAWNKASISTALKNYESITDIGLYETSLEGYINTNLPIIIQDSSRNPELEWKQQVILWTISGMQKKLYDMKQKASWKQPIEFFNGKIIYSWLQLAQFWLFVKVLNFIAITILTLIIILASGWKNMIILYLFLMESLSAKFENLQSNETFQKISSINKRMKEIGTDIKEWDILVQNWQNKEIYIVLILEIMVRVLIIYNIIYF